MRSICETLRDKRVLVSDGAWGTMLMEAGLAPGKCPESWNIERPEAVRQVAEHYIAAGADMVSTNSFGGTAIKLARHGLGGSVREINRTAAALSREAAGNDHFVIASIGPTGKMLQLEDVTEAELYDAFRDQALALEEGGANACCIETMSAIDEAAIAVRAVKENTGLEIICTFTFDRAIEGRYWTMMGVSPEAMATAMREAGAHIIGTNCSQGPATMIPIVAAMRRAAPGLPILVQPNAGMPIHTESGTRFPESPDSFAGYVPALLEAGASILGGCCGTTPEHIEKLAAAVRTARGSLR
ncbi:MAG: homocysteine S-methyltransferase family protein [Candidatus Hydrogenedentes bacterium]|nr:homocysteine S-methyltransferase family protein [Candidatus Hydrogenedentota bacterium]